jgi:hypothetical protein
MEKDQISSANISCSRMIPIQLVSGRITACAVDPSAARLKIDRLATSGWTP